MVDEHSAASKETLEPKNAKLTNIDDYQIVMSEEYAVADKANERNVEPHSFASSADNQDVSKSPQFDKGISKSHYQGPKEQNISDAQDDDEVARDPSQDQILASR